MLGACLMALVVGGVLLARAKEGKTMDSTRTIGPIPAIDAAAPTKTETATFALG